MPRSKSRKVQKLGKQINELEFLAKLGTLQNQEKEDELKITALNDEMENEMGDVLEKSVRVQDLEQDQMACKESSWEEEKNQLLKALRSETEKRKQAETKMKEMEEILTKNLSQNKLMKQELQLVNEKVCQVVVEKNEIISQLMAAQETQALETESKLKEMEALVQVNTQTINKACEELKVKEMELTRRIKPRKEDEKREKEEKKTEGKARRAWTKVKSFFLKLLCCCP